MQPTPDDILTREIPTPQLGQTFKPAHIDGAYLPLVSTLAQSAALGQAHIEALTATIVQKDEQIAALKTALATAQAEQQDRKINGAVRDLVSATKAKDG